MSTKTCKSTLLWRALLIKEKVDHARGTIPIITKRTTLGSRTKKLRTKTSNEEERLNRTKDRKWSNKFEMQKRKRNKDYVRLFWAFTIEIKIQTRKKSKLWVTTMISMTSAKMHLQNKTMKTMQWISLRRERGKTPWLILIRGVATIRRSIWTLSFLGWVILKSKKWERTNQAQQS